MPKPLRIFISSPGDVSSERRRAALVVESLKKEFARFFDISAYLWEHEAMLATGHFQDVIEPPSQSDIVVLILWSRLGTPLPERSGAREYRGLDGRAPVTGTEWEYEDALAANRAKGAPDLLVYRSEREPQISLRDPAKKALAESQWNALEGFWQRYFQAGGVFLSAYHGFEDLEDFGDMLEAHLRQLIRARIEKSRAETGADVKATWLQSPFRGLSAFDFEHAPIFFGRGAAQLRAVERIVRNAASHKAFLLVLGASGSGKSSLVRAGVLPNLFARGVADGVGLWRRVIFKPGDADGDLFLGLAKALAENDVKNGVGLPEILGPGVELEQLANALRRSIDDPAFVFAPALGRVTQEARAAQRIMAHETARVALVLDQLEEIFTDASIPTEDRNAFIRLISSLAKGDQVWTVATMRSDFWHKAAAAPELVELAEGTGRMDLLPPSQAELAEMIRRPAAAAGLSFEDHGETRIGLDAVIAEEASRDPGSLPLVSFVLDALYKADVQTGRGSTLTYDTYEKLGGLRGAIATRADEIVNALPAAVQAALPSVLRALVTVDGDGERNATARMAPLSAFPTGSPRRALVDAFLDPQARLLIADGDGSEARVRVAHEALINHWTRAREQIARDRRDLETRARLEEDEAVWRAAPAQEKAARLLEGLALEEGKDLVVKWDDELPPSLKEYIAESRQAADRKRRRSFRIMTGVAAAMSVLAAASAAGGFYALQQTEVAEAEAARAVKAEGVAEESLKETQRGNARLVARQSGVASRGGYSELALSLAVESIRMAEQTGDTIQQLPIASVGALQHAASTDTIVSVLAAYDSALGDISFGGDASSLFTGGYNQLTLWDVFSGTERFFFGSENAPFVSADVDRNGRYLGVIFSDKTLQIYDGTTYNLLGDTFTFTDAPVAIDVDDDGGMVAVAEESGQVTFIDLATHEIKGKGNPHNTKPLHVAVAANRAIAVSVEESGRATIWDLTTFTPRSTVYHGSQEFPLAIDRVTVSPNGDQFIVSGGGTASVFSAQGELLKYLNIPDVFLYRTLYTPDGSTILYAAGKDVTAISSADFSTRKTFSGHTFDVRGLEMSRDGRRILTSSGDNTMRLWDYDSAATLRLFRSPKGSIQSQSLSQDGNFVAGVFDDGAAVVWSVDGLSPASARLVHTWNISSARWSKDGSSVLTASGDGTATLSDVETSHPEFTLQTGTNDALAAFFTPDGREIITLDGKSQLRAWSALDGSEKRLIAKSEDFMKSALITPDGKSIIASIYGGLRVFDAAATNGTALRTLHAADLWLFNSAISPDGKYVASGSEDGRLFVWDFASGKRVYVRREDRSAINGVSFSPDGKKLVTASSDRTIRIWDVETGTPTMLLTGHDDIVMSATFSADGQRVVSSGFDATVRVWDAATGAELIRFSGPGKPFRAAALNADGTLLAAAGDDRRLYIWKMPEKNFANTPTGGPVSFSALNADDGKLLKELVATAPLTISKPLSPSDRRDNFLPADPTVREFDPAADACHVLADYQSDPQRLAPGVREGTILASDAVPACREALEKAPNEPRLKLQLGRALIAEGKIEEGLKLAQEAADAGYPGAIYYRGFYPVTNGGSSADLRAGWENVRKAWELGVPDAGDLLGAYTRSGLKSSEGEEIVKADPAAALEFYRQASQKGSWFSSSNLAGKYEFGEDGLEKNMAEALYFYALAARQMEVEGFIGTTESARATYMTARRASIARGLLREGKSADVAAVAQRVSEWTPPHYEAPAGVEAPVQ